MVECLSEHVVLGKAKTDVECFWAFFTDVVVCLSKSEKRQVMTYAQKLKLIYILYWVYWLICIVPPLPEFQHLWIFISDEVSGFHFFKSFIHGDVEIPI